MSHTGLSFFRPFIADHVLSAIDSDSTQRLEMMGRREGLDGQRSAHAFHLKRSFLVIGLQFAAEDGRVLDGGVNHAFNARIHAKLRFAGAEILQIVARLSLADISPGRRRLELKFFFWHRQLGGRRGQLSVTGLLAAGLVNHHVRVGQRIRFRARPTSARQRGSA